MPARHGLTALTVLLLVLSAASLVHSSTVARAQSGGAAPTGIARLQPPLTGKAGEGLPLPAADMREAVLEAARSGRLEELRQAVELNEIRPVIGSGDESDPIAALRKASRDGEGRDVLAAIERILESDWIAVPLGRDVENNLVYVWPRFAETGVVGLGVDEIADLSRALAAGELAPMLEKGVYDGWRIGIAADGTWHFLRR